MGTVEKLEQYISKGEISKPRTVEEFIRWIDEKHAVLRNRRLPLNEQNLLRHGIAKIFYEEILPLYCLLKNKACDWHEERFKLVLGGQNYDVEIQTNRFDVPKRIEITVADMDKEEKTRMRHLLDHRSVAEVIQDVPERIRERIAKKMTVQGRPDDTALLVYFDDYTDFPFHREESKRRMDIVLDKIDIPWGNRYIALYVVGASGKSLWQRMKSGVSLVKVDKIASTFTDSYSDN